MESPTIDRTGPPYYRGGVEERGSLYGLGESESVAEVKKKEEPVRAEPRRSTNAWNSSSEIWYEIL